VGTLASAIVPGSAMPLTGTIIDIEDFSGRLHVKVIVASFRVNLVLNSVIGPAPG
jgi:hypothetical protein